MEILLRSLALSALITGGFSLFLAIALIPRLYKIWKQQRIMQLAMPCQDAEQARFRIVEAFKGIGEPTAPETNGSFRYEPSSWRRKFGLAPVAIDFPQPQLALLTGQQTILTMLAAKQKLPLVPAPDSPNFGLYLKRKAKLAYWFSGSVFVILFLLFAIVAPPGIAPRKATVAPVQETPFVAGER